jgi:hypothetical protein
VNIVFKIQVAARKVDSLGKLTGKIRVIDIYPVSMMAIRIPAPVARRCTASSCIVLKDVCSGL